MTTSAFKAAETVHRPPTSGSLDPQLWGHVLIIDDTASGVLRCSDEGDLTSDALAACTAARAGRSPQDVTGVTRSGRPSGIAGWWLRRLAAATMPLLIIVAAAAPAFAWPECAC